MLRFSKYLIFGFPLYAIPQSMLADDLSHRQVDPTFLHRYIPDVQPKASDVTTETCVYKPLFGAGDSASGVLKGVVRFGEITVMSGGKCKAVTYPAEEQALVIMDGGGTLQYSADISPIKKNDFLYLPAGIKHELSNGAAVPLRLFVMGFKVPPGTPPPAKLQIANLDEVKTQTVGGHPDSVVYQLMIGDTKSTRDRLASGHLITSLFLMTFEPGGTNFPHHHDNEEEIYVLLDGSGEMVAGSGMDGVEGRFPAKPGDAYFYRLNTTVGFYNSMQGPAHILAIRSIYPRNRKASAP